MLFDDEEDNLFEDDDLIDIEETELISGDMPAPRAQHALIGHMEIEQDLLRLFQSGRHPHAMIFSGPSGIGKATLAFRLARFLLKTSEDEYNEAIIGAGLFGDTKAPPPSLNVDAKDPVFSKVAAGGHPDLLTIERLYDDKKDRRKTEVSVDEIRKIAPFMRKTPAIEGGWRIVIVDDADTMNRSSQNSILKILEEPPAKSLIILVTHRLGALLPTILSRASVVNFYPLADDVLTEFLTRVNPKLLAEHKTMIVNMAEGSLGRAIDYVDDKNFAVITQSLDMLAKLPKFDWNSIQHFADNLVRGATPEMQKSFQDALIWFSSSFAMSAATGRDLPPALKPAARLLSEVSLAGWLQICDRLNEHFTRVQAGNLDKRYMVMGAFTVFENNV